MHTVFGVSSILLVLLGGSALLSLLRLIQDGSHRRVVQLFILTTGLSNSPI
ncbi:hypothetical protein KSF_111970 [Reticulibacter mediterranei]|uniref:Uncharacterized protein n=1 Tax=Reticulibacter mediterranei TaxID=2778369 RepID=A0A8J3J036_9CHLR|nr:hypothetical protein KSF_111970 [Reticulibacter mediterranei]